MIKKDMSKKNKPTNHVLLSGVNESALREKIKSILSDIEKMDSKGEWYGFMNDSKNTLLVTKLWNYCK